VFSHSTRALDIIQHVLNSKGLLFERIDGQTNRRVRQKRVDQFNKSTQPTVFLLSTKAAGLGLTITGASRVIVFDREYLG
jgi:SNF2 family DNA or RNA helicase